jgi:hypothetical protein
VHTSQGFTCACTALESIIGNKSYDTENHDAMAYSEMPTCTVPFVTISASRRTSLADN